MTKAAASVLALMSLVACGPAGREETDGEGDGEGEGDGDGSGSSTETPRQCEKMDIVFVVDDSGSMQEEQSNLGTNFPMFAQVLKNYTTSDGTPVDFRVAVTTTARDISYNVSVPGFGTLPQNEMGDNGEFRNTCNNPARWLEGTDPNLESTLTCRANVGTMGSGIEMPLLMSKWSLSERVVDQTNAGFIREDALLAIVILTDEDDASTTEDGFTMDASASSTPTNWNPADQVMFLDTLKGNRTRWAAGVIAGDGNCSSGFGNAADGVRLKEFVQQANSNGYQQAVFSSICDGNLAVSLKSALDLFQSACGQIIL